MSALYTAQVEELVEGPPERTPADPKAAARSCFIAAIIYAIFFGFCYCQVCLFKTHSQDVFPFKKGPRGRSIHAHFCGLLTLCLSQNGLKIYFYWLK